jgi:hypothetical protein
LELLTVALAFLEMQLKVFVDNDRKPLADTLKKFNCLDLIAIQVYG